MKGIVNKWSTLLPELKMWNNGKGIEPDDWIACIGDIEHAIGFSTVFWPEFVVYEDCIFIGDMNEDIFKRWYKICKNDKKKLEFTINHRHVADLFSTGIDTSVEQIKYVGYIIKEMWESKLRKDYPNRKIIVDLIEQNNDDVTRYILTVYQEKHEFDINIK